MIKKLFILSLFLLTSISLCLASEQIIFSGVPADTPLNNEYAAIVVSSATRWDSSINDVQELVSAAGVLSNFRVKLSAAPGSGNSRTLTVLKEGVPQTLKVTFDATDVQKEDISNPLTLSPGDKITIQQTQTGTPNAGYFIWSFTWVPTTSDETIICGGTGSTANNRYYSPFGLSGGSLTEFDRAFIVPTSGTLKKLYVWQETAPSGRTETWTIRKDGSPTALVAEVADGANTANSGVLSITVTAGEAISLVTENNDATGGAWGLIFVPDTTGEFIVAMTSDNTTLGGATEYQGISGGDDAWRTTEADRAQLGQACTIKKLYVKSENAVGTGDTLVFTLRINGADSSPLLSITLSQTESSGNASADVSVANNDLLSMEMVASEVNTVAFSLLGFILPPAVTKIQGATLQGATIN